MGGRVRDSCLLGLPSGPAGMAPDLAGDSETNRELWASLVPLLIFPEC